MTRNTRSGTTRRRLLQGAGAGAAAALAGCLSGGGGTDGNQATTPTGAEVFMLTDYDGDAWTKQWDSLSSSFTESSGIKVSVEYSGMSGEQETRLAQLIQSGDPPDINTSTFDQVADIWSAGNLETTTEIANQAQEVNGKLSAAPYEGENGDIWQVSHGYYAGTFMYRQDIYDELGLSVPTSFQGIVDNAKAISESDLSIAGYGLAGQTVGKAQDEFQTYLAYMGESAIGLRWKNPDQRNELEIAFPEDKVTTLLEFFKTLSQYSVDPTSIGWGSSIRSWVGGQYAQQYHLNNWPIGIAAGLAESSSGAQAEALRTVAENSGIAPIPAFEEGGVSQQENWLFEPTPDGHHIFSGGDNTPGAKRWLEYLYADSAERTAGLYAAEPTRFVPNYQDVITTDTFQNFGLFQAYPRLFDQLQYVQDTIVADFYGNVPESDLNDPVALYVTRQWFYSEMVNRVVTGSSTVQEAYDYGRRQLERRLKEGRERFR